METCLLKLRAIFLIQLSLAGFRSMSGILLSDINVWYINLICLLFGWIAINKMKSKLHYDEQFHNVLEKEKSIQLTQISTIAHFHGMIQTLQ